MTTTPKSFASPAPGRGLNKPWEEVPTVPTDKVNALMLSASAHKWEVVVTVHEPGKPRTHLRLTTSGLAGYRYVAKLLLAHERH